MLKYNIFRIKYIIEINYKDILLNLNGACVSFRHPSYNNPGGENRRITFVIIFFIWRSTSTCQRNASSRYYILISLFFVSRSLSRRPLFLIIKIDLINLSSPLKIESRAVKITSRIYIYIYLLLIVQRVSASLPERVRFLKFCFLNQTLYPLPQLQIQKESSPI